MHWVPSYLMLDWFLYTCLDYGLLDFCWGFCLDGFPAAFLPFIFSACLGSLPACHSYRSLDFLYSCLPGLCSALCYGHKLDTWMDSADATCSFSGFFFFSYICYILILLTQYILWIPLILVG